MKEYLVKKNGKLILATSETKLSSSVIGVPRGADIYVQFNRRMKVFYKENFKYVYQDSGWSETSYTDENIEYWNNLPVLWRREQEIKMKEYLDANNGYQLINADEREASEYHAKDWIEVPEGADYLTLHTIKSGYFWTEDGKYIGWGGANNIHPEWKQYEMGEGVHHYADERNIKIVWRREKTVEYLDPSDWSLQTVGENIITSGSWIKVPEGAEFYHDEFVDQQGGAFYKDNYSKVYDCNRDFDGWLKCYSEERYISKHSTLRWTRHTKPEELPFIDDEPINNGPYEMETKSSFNSDDIKYMDGCSFGKTESISDDPVNHPSHYVTHPSGIECIEITRHHDFAIGNAIKYLWRAGLKGSDNEVQDLKKAIWYIQDKINQLEKSNVSHNQGS